MAEEVTPIDQIKRKHILIDGDIVKYRCAASAEKTKYLIEVNGEFHKRDTHKEALYVAKEDSAAVIWSRKEIQPLEFALQACKTTIDTLLAKLEPSKVSIFLSPERTFRNDVARTKPYKGNRDQPKPKYLKDVGAYLAKQYGAVTAVNVEADDSIGIALTEAGEGAVSISIDKDLLQIPGWHYNWVNDRVQRITPKQGNFNFYSQLLTGDATDNVPGITGIGDKGAVRILDGAKSSADLCSRVWSVYRGEFTSAEKARTYFLEQGQLLWILRYRATTPGYPQQFTPHSKLDGV